MTLSEFLTARLAEDEALVLADRPSDDPTDAEEDAPDYYDRWFAAVDLHKRQPHGSECAWRVSEGMQAACDCGYPTRVLRQVEAHRAIVADYTETFDAIMARAKADAHAGLMPNDVQEAIAAAAGILTAAKHLAAIYSDHPDYRDEWRP